MKKYWKHLKTICKHKAVVFHECWKCGIIWQGITHDLSKFGFTEFVSSAKHFQGDRSPIDAEKEAIGYSRAWLHHKGHNKHHWEYWTDFDNRGYVICSKVPYKYVVEMICDWIGAGKTYSKGKWTQQEPLTYFNKVKDSRRFHPDTLKLIYKFLDEIYFNGLEGFYKLAKTERRNYEG